MTLQPPGKNTIYLIRVCCGCELMRFGGEMNIHTYQDVSRISFLHRRDWHNYKWLRTCCFIKITAWWWCKHQICHSSLRWLLIHVKFRCKKFMTLHLSARTRLIWRVCFLVPKSCIGGGNKNSHISDGESHFIYQSLEWHNYDWLKAYYFFV